MFVMSECYFFSECKRVLNGKFIDSQTIDITPWYLDVFEFAQIGINSTKNSYF